MTRSIYFQRSPPNGCFYTQSIKKYFDPVVFPGKTFSVLRPHVGETKNITYEELGEEAEKSDLHQAHRIGAFQEEKNKSKPVIVKFTRYNVRDKVFKNKKTFEAKVQ